MSLYVAVDESYLASKLCNLAHIVRYCASYTLQDGSVITKKNVSEMLKNGWFDVYSYDSEQLAEAKENNGIRGVEWSLKIQKI